MKELMSILSELRPDVDFENEKSLITDGVLDSLDIVALIDELNDEFNVNIKPGQITVENFDSAEMIYNLIKSIQ